MATLKRQTAKLFAGEADLTNLGEFGSAADGQGINPTAPSLPTDPSIEDQIQTAKYTEGWTEAVVTTKNFPPIEEVNGVLRTISYQTCYLLQEGIPTWDANTAYDLTSIVKVVNGSELLLYHPIQLDANNECKGHELNETTWWEKVIITGDKKIGDPQITLDFSSSLPANCVDLRGQRYAITSDPGHSDYKYQQLFAIYGRTYSQSGDSASTFRVPDFSDNLAIYGGTSAGVIASGLPDLGLSITSSGAHTHTASAAANGSHNHTKGTMRIVGKIETSSSDDEPLTFSNIITATGAFAVGGYKSWANGGAETKSGASYNVFSFDTNRDSNPWTGNTSTEPNHTHTITVNSTNSNHTHTITHNGIIGSMNRVYAKGTKVRVFTRYQ